MSVRHSYYAILGCEENASTEDIKKCFHAKALAYHPDKNTAYDNNGINFEIINNAWKTLSDPEARKVYDAKLNDERCSKHTVVFGIFTQDQLEFDSANNVHSVTCRCGGQFAINSEDLAECNSCDISVECDTCSLVVYVKPSWKPEVK